MSVFNFGVSTCDFVCHSISLAISIFLDLVFNITVSTIKDTSMQLLNSAIVLNYLIFIALKTIHIEFVRQISK